MTRPKDIDALSADEVLLVDLLYGELAGEEETAARKVVEDKAELAAELETLRGLRQMMRELPDEEPPAAISARLLHAAAQHAPAPKRTAVSAAAGGGIAAWLKRLFRPMMLHPAMAAATTFVLVAGVAGALYVSGRVGVSEPGAPSEQARPDVAESAGEMAMAEVREVPAVATPAAGPAAGLPRVEFDEDLAVGEMEAADEPATQQTASTGSSAAGPRLGGKDVARSTKAKPGAKRRRAAAEPKGGGGYGVSDKADRRKKAPAPEPSRPSGGTKAAEKKPAPDYAPAPVRGTAGDSVLADTEQPRLKSLKEGEADERERRVAQARSWHQKAIQAARDGECDAVNEIGQRIRKLDSRYYDTVYLRDKRLFECRRKAPNAKKKQ